MDSRRSRRRWAGVFRRAPGPEIDDELEFHIERRTPDEPGPWHEIVGVVPDLGIKVSAQQDRDPRTDPKVAGFYHPASPGTMSPLHVALHVRGDPTGFAPIVRAHAAAVDPAMRLAALVMGVCKLACVVPTRRALAVEPREALRADA